MIRCLALVFVSLVYAAPAVGQHVHPQPRSPQPPASRPGETAEADRHTHGQPPRNAPPRLPDAHDHSVHDTEPAEPDHSSHQQPPPAHHDHAHDEYAHDGHHAPAGDLPPFIPPITDAERAAAFPDVMGPMVHDNAINYFVLFDQLEWRSGRDQVGEWEALGWVGRDIDRIWFRSEGTGQRDGLHHGEAHVFYGRAVRRWWDVLAGVRHDFGQGPNRTWAGVGVQGLAPYWFEVHATAWIGEAGRTHVRLETEYEFLLTNRLILKPLVEIDVHGKSDVARGIGAGLSSVDAGLRLRYEFRREFAPYVGVTWDRKFFGTADLARTAGDRTSGARLAIGLRLWL